ncbi:MAG TPA: hypothetical protein VHX88_21210 [Solirubrobacteraceae bacterium]|nr:hypothetical protein [Solirubrobacteraceae bacterium]
MRRAVPAALVVILCAVFASSAAAETVTQTATSGQVSATFTFQTSTSAAFPYSDLALSISRAGALVYNQPVDDAQQEGCGTTCEPQSPTGHSVQVADIEGNGEPDVILHLFSGGAHCCSIDQVFSYDATTNTYASTTHEWGDPGERIVDLDHNGKLEFLSADDRFAYEFESYAFSGLPIQIWTFSAGTFTNVTGQFPAQVAKDAKQWWKDYLQNRPSSGNGAIAAWAADEDTLGHRALVAKTLAQQNAKHDLRAPNSLSLPGGKRFIKALQALLRKTGYT